MNEKREDAEAIGAQSGKVGNRKELLDNPDDVKIPTDASPARGEATYKDGDRHLEPGESLKRASGTSDKIDIPPSKKLTQGRRSNSKRTEGNKRRYSGR